MNSILNWIILDNILFGYDEDLKNKINNSNIKKIILFDLDYTLIKTKSGKTFPIDKNDWDYLIDIVPLTITQYINNNSICSIKKLIIIISMVSLIYLLLHQINIDSQSKLYNKILIIIMIIDIVISLFFLSDTFIKKM